MMLDDLVPFLVPAILSGFCYLLANCIARIASTSSRRIYAKRLVSMLVISVVWWAYYLPYGTRPFIGNLADGDTLWAFYRNHWGALYGAQTIWAWWIVALVDRPKVSNEDSQNP